MGELGGSCRNVAPRPHFPVVIFYLGQAAAPIYICSIVEYSTLAVAARYLA